MNYIPPWEHLQDFEPTYPSTQILLNGRPLGWLNREGLGGLRHSLVRDAEIMQLLLDHHLDMQRFEIWWSRWTWAILTPLGFLLLFLAGQLTSLSLHDRLLMWPVGFALCLIGPFSYAVTQLAEIKRRERINRLTDEVLKCQTQLATFDYTFAVLP